MSCCHAPRQSHTHTHRGTHSRAWFLVVLPNRASPSLPSPSQRGQRSQGIHPSVRPSVCPSWAVNPARRTLLRARCARLLTRSLPPSSPSQGYPNGQRPAAAPARGALDVSGGRLPTCGRRLLEGFHERDWGGCGPAILGRTAIGPAAGSGGATQPSGKRANARKSSSPFGRFSAPGQASPRRHLEASQGGRSQSAGLHHKPHTEHAQAAPPPPFLFIPAIKCPPPFLLFLQRPLVSFRARREPSQASSKSPALHWISSTPTPASAQPS